MTTFHFDRHGCLIPYDLIETDWESFVNTFGWNDSRRELINLLHSFMMELDRLSVKTFTVWLDGSFVTRKEHPKDLDVVFFLPSEVYRQFERNLRTLRNNYNRLDVYFVRTINEAEPDYFLYVSDRTEWLFQFAMTKPDRLTRRKFPKGFLEITWNHESALQRT